MEINDAYISKFRKFSKENKRNIMIRNSMALLAIAALVLLKYSNFHIYHFAVEIFAAVISFCIFIVALNTYPISQNDFFMTLGIGYVCVGVLDLLHTFSYSDLNVFANSSSDLPIQFWMVARVAELATVLYSTSFIDKKNSKSNYSLTAAVGIAYMVLAMSAIMKYDILPVFKVEGQGLTAAKKAIEYAVAAGFLISLAVIYGKRKMMDSIMFVYIGISILLKVPQGICFTMYLDKTDTIFFIGHLIKIASYYFMYKAIVEIGLQRPLEMLITDLDNADSSIKEKERQRKLLEEAITGNEACYDLIIDHAEDGIAIIREDRVIYANSTAATLLGASDKSELIGRTPYEFLAGEHAAGLKDRFSKLLKEKSRVPFEETAIAAIDGNPSSLEFSYNYFIYRKVPAILAIIRDMTAQKEIRSLKKDISESQKKLIQSQEYNRVLTEFFANISHELKTPLAIILGTVQLISLSKEEHKGIYKDKINSYTSIMKQNIFRLIRLVNNLIDTSKYDSGHMKLNLHNLDIVSVVENICLSVKDYVNSKDIAFMFDTDIEEKIMAVDADQIERIVLNLLSNAVKFTDRGGEIQVNLEDLCDRVRISIKDTGVGIPADMQQVIFDRFGQVDKTFTRNREGSGIGLSLVKTLIEMHGGEIGVISKLGEGSKFSFELPVTFIEEEETAFSQVFEDKVEKINIEFSDIYEN